MDDDIHFWAGGPLEERITRWHTDANVSISDAARRAYWMMPDVLAALDAARTRVAGLEALEEYFKLGGDAPTTAASEARPRALCTFPCDVLVFALRGCLASIRDLCAGPRPRSYVFGAALLGAFDRADSTSTEGE